MVLFSFNSIRCGHVIFNVAQEEQIHPRRSSPFARRHSHYISQKTFRLILTQILKINWSRGPPLTVSDAEVVEAGEQRLCWIRFPPSHRILSDRNWRRNQNDGRRRQQKRKHASEYLRMFSLRLACLAIVNARVILVSAPMGVFRWLPTLLWRTNCG